MPLALASAAVELPYLVGQTLLFFPLSYYLIGFRATADATGLYVATFFLSISLYTFMGQFFAYLLPTPVLALVCGGALHLCWQMFNGFLLPRPRMAAGWRWLNYISGTTWVVYGIGAAQLNQPSHMLVPGRPPRRQLCAMTAHA